MIQELLAWLDTQRISYIPVDTEVVDIPGSDGCSRLTCQVWNPFSAVTAINLSSI